MIHFTWLDLAMLGAILAWPLIALVAAAFAIAWWRRPAMRQRPLWRRTGIAIIAVLVADSLLASPVLGMLAQEQIRAWQVAYYAYHLKAPRTLDGIDFPAGSVVKLTVDPPHSLESGTVPVPTEIFGLEVIGEFAVRGHADGSGFVELGTLASEATINTVPCAPGPFARDPEDVTLRCRLARDFPIGGVVLGAGTPVYLWPGARRLQIDEGTLVQTAQLMGLTCGAGPITYNFFQVRCVLAGDQLVEGIPLAGGRPAALLQTDGKRELQEGTLATPFELLGVTLPAGARVERVSGDELSFVVPANADLPVHGATVRGQMEITFSHGKSIRVEQWYRGLNQSGTLEFAGRRHMRGDFDAAHDHWRFGPETGSRD